MSKISNYGIITISLLFTLFYSLASAQADTLDQQKTKRYRSASAFPILMYDSDIGFGLGGRGIIKNQLQSNESFDLILFASTKGEQWYVFTFSVPDFEIRQGSAYPLALDLKVEYDKLLKSNFFGFGNDSESNDWQFPREFMKIETILGHAFSEQIIGEVGFLINHTSVYDYKEINPILSAAVPGTGEHMTSYFTARLRLDTRDSQINPQRGWKLSLNSDFGFKILGGDYHFTRYRLEFSKYQMLFTNAHIMAVRFWSQQIKGTPPYYEQSILGGGWTARGFKAERFIDLALTLVSVEYRFPLYKKLGAVLFIDSGRVFSGIEKSNLNSWKTSQGIGLRYYLENFLVRLDVGTSKEGARIFFNFGHVF